MHSEDMPLKHPRKNCAFKNGDECTWHPATLRYVQENNIPWDMSTKFRCVLHKCAWCKKSFETEKELTAHRCPNISIFSFEILPLKTGVE